MKHTHTDDRYLITIDQGENFIESLTAFAKKHDIKNAAFTGIGAVDYIKCGYYHLSEKKYHFTEYNSLCEVVSLTGNIALKESTPFVHAHGVFTDEENKAFGGHIEEMRVGVTLEIALTPLATEIERKLDEDIGLFLLDLPEQDS